MKIYHITWASKGRNPAFPTEEARRAVLHAIAAVAGKNLALFAIVDDHVHLVLLLEPERLPSVQASLTRVLGNRAAVELAPPFVRNVATRAHMSSLVGYCLDQFAHHGLTDDPATATGSCFPDLVGARRIPGLTLQLAAALPRFRLREAYDAVRLVDKLVPAADALVRGLGPTRLGMAVASTYGVCPDFVGNTPGVARARWVAARLAADVGVHPSETAVALGITAVAAARLGARPIDPADLRAVRLRIALDAAAAARPARPAAAEAPRLVREPPPPPYELQPIMHRILGQQRVPLGA